MSQVVAIGSSPGNLNWGTRGPQGMQANGVMWAHSAAARPGPPPGTPVGPGQLQESLIPPPGFALQPSADVGPVPLPRGSAPNGAANGAANGAGQFQLQIREAGMAPTLLARLGSNSWLLGAGGGYLLGGFKGALVGGLATHILQSRGYLGSELGAFGASCEKLERKYNKHVGKPKGFITDHPKWAARRLAEAQAQSCAWAAEAGQAQQYLVDPSTQAQYVPDVAGSAGAGVASSIVPILTIAGLGIAGIAAAFYLTK